MPSGAYRIVIEPVVAEEGGGFLATVPDLPGCISDGETEAEAMHNAGIAIADWIAHAKAEGRHIPQPANRRFYA
ncbi:type II toxin-antitoxin system HicB family antitoxin [Caulobacter sp. BK020]|uniref:type II toxin-antitoxin system HicB family antitoxin n=1 Tax=Caulobacter sp. BK020 TaxID=2512117 RepID=UPI0010486710|nr:type II toxin-antitoxin system HicB family antitoxin [Caulobacter sp. BK020]TCS11951.1 putative RNase H-like HicB family nuclease [Caulobacter sp. BK020]HWU12753.1 type II toxin-antitoxin system HicB family antitoxin [Caulobacter sp.]